MASPIWRILLAVTVFLSWLPVVFAEVIIRVETKEGKRLANIEIEVQTTNGESIGGKVWTGKNGEHNCVALPGKHVRIDIHIRPGAGYVAKWHKQDLLMLKPGQPIIIQIERSRRQL